MTKVSNALYETSAGWGLAGLALSVLMGSMGVSGANIALPTLALAFDASFQQVQWVVLVYLMAITVMVVGVGRLGDMLGHRRVLIAGIALFTAASILCGVAPAFWVLIGARTLQGIGAAILMSVAMALVRETVPDARTGSAMGLLGTVSATGTALGPSLGGVLIAGPGWRAIFLIMVPLGAVALALAHRHLPGRACQAKTERAGFAWPGTLWLGLALAAYALAMTAGGGRFDGFNLALLAVAGLAVTLFVRAQSKAARPLLRLAALRDPTLGAGLAMNALVATVMMTTLVVGPFYLSLALGLNEATVGLVMAVGPVISIVSGVPAGRVVDSLGAERVTMAGLAAMAIGTFALALLPGMLGVAGYVAAMAALTPGYQLFQAANNTAVMMNVAEDRRGITSGMLGLSRNLGLITGASAMGAVFALASGASDVSAAGAAAVAHGMEITFLTAGGLTVAALGIGLGRHLTAGRKDGEFDQPN